MQFYLVRDRDYLTNDYANQLSNHASGRVHVLNRHEIENYLLDDEVIAKVQTEIFANPTTAPEVREKLRTVARELSTDVLRDMVQYRLNLQFTPADFSLGKFMHGEDMLDGSGEWMPAKTAALTTRFTEKAKEVSDALAQATNDPAVAELVARCKDEVKAALGDGDGWRTTFPGKELLEAYASKEGLGKPPAFQNSLIKELSTDGPRVPQELARIIETIAGGKLFSTEATN